MFTDIREHIKLTRDERRNHLRLNEPCIEIGGYSSFFKGLLAHYLRTTIPVKKDLIHLCHGCHNGLCSNPNHLYWGTNKDNHIDAMQNGQLTIHEKCIKKFGSSEWFRRHKETGRILGKTFGRVYGGKNKHSDERLEEIKRIFLSVNLCNYGWVGEVADKLKITHTQVRRLKVKYFPELKSYKRKIRG